MNTRWKVIIEVECNNKEDALDQLENAAKRLVYQRVSTAKVISKAKLFFSTDDGEVWNSSGPEEVS